MPPRESVTELLRRIIDHSTVLARDEIELTKQEVREKVDKLSSAGIILAAGVMICLIALMSLCAALVINLTNYMSLTMAALITGAALGLIGTVIAIIGGVKIRNQL